MTSEKDVIRNTLLVLVVLCFVFLLTRTFEVSPHVRVFVFDIPLVLALLACMGFLFYKVRGVIRRMNGK